MTNEEFQKSVLELLAEGVNALESIAESLRPQNIMIDSKMNTQDIADAVLYATAGTPQTKSKKRKPPTKEAAPSSKLWDTYRLCFNDRYRVDPVRNAQVNSQLKQLLSQVGEDAGHTLIAFYVQSNEAFYVRNRHPIGLLVKDHHKLTIDMTKGRAVTHRDAQRFEETSASADEMASFLREKSERNDEAPF